MNNFQNDVFISFTHIDNPRIMKQEGWVSRFHDALEPLLSTRLGTPARIWRDRDLRDGDVLSKKVIDELRRSAIMLSIVTPRYLNSGWCQREVDEFSDHAKNTGGMIVGNAQRLVPVVKTPIDGPIPDFLKDVRFNNFFSRESGAPKEFDEIYGEKSGQDFINRLTELAYSLKLILVDMQGEVSSASGKPAIYLAECTPDRRRDRDLIGAELRRLGYPVLPEGPLPWDEAGYVAAVDEMLSRSVLSIHLIGSLYGDIPNGPSGKPTPIHQNEIAVSHARKETLKRLISLPAQTTSELPAQQAFIKALRENEETQFGADLIAGDVEELKTAIHTTLKKIEEPEPKLEPEPAPVADAAAPQPVADGEKKAVYIVHDVRDRDNKDFVPLRKLCVQLGLKVLLPAFEGEAARIRKAKEEFLATCDLVLVFYGAGDEAWMRSMDTELMRLPGYRKKRPLPKALTYVSGTVTPDKQGMIEIEEPDLVNGLDAFPDTALTKAIKDALGIGRGSP